MKLLTLILTGALLVGCAALEPGSLRPSVITRAQVDRYIVKGKTTKADLIREFGLPDTTTLMSSLLPGMDLVPVPYELLSYSKIYLQYPTTVSTLKVVVTKQEIVADYFFSGSEVLAKGVPDVSASTSNPQVVEMTEAFMRKKEDAEFETAFAALG
jgi:hypothetical protein